jgi:hypothetical protein
MLKDGYEAGMKGTVESTLTSEREQAGEGSSCGYSYASIRQGSR